MENQNNNLNFQNRNWFYKLGIYLTKDNLNSLLLISFFISFGIRYFDPFSWFGAAGLALCLANQNLIKMLQTLGYVCLICLGLTFLDHNLLQTNIAIKFTLSSLFIQAIIPALVIAFAYKLSESLSLVLIFLLDLIFILAIICIPFYDEILSFITNILLEVFSNPAIKELIFSQINSDETMQELSKKTLSVIFASLYFQYVIVAFISKKWLNQKNNQFLSVGDELVKLKAYDWMGIVMIAILLLNYWFIEITFFKLIFATYMSYFFILGISLMHQFLRKRKSGTGVIIVSYTLVVVFGEISLIVFSTIATARCIKNFFIKNKTNI